MLFYKSYELHYTYLGHTSILGVIKPNPFQFFGNLKPEKAKILHLLHNIFWDIGNLVVMEWIYLISEELEKNVMTEIIK